MFASACGLYPTKFTIRTFHLLVLKNNTCIINERVDVCKRLNKSN